MAHVTQEGKTHPIRHSQFENLLLNPKSDNQYDPEEKAKPFSQKPEFTKYQQEDQCTPGKMTSVDDSLLQNLDYGLYGIV